MRKPSENLPPFTPLEFRMEFTTRTVDAGYRKMHWVIILVPPEDNGYLPDVISGRYYSSGFRKDYIQNIPYAFHSRGRIFFGDGYIDDEVDGYNFLQKILREDYQFGIVCYANYQAAKEAEKSESRDFLLIEDEYLTEHEWDRFRSSKAIKRGRKILGRYHSMAGARYSLTQRAHYLESLSGRATLSPRNQRTDWQVKYPYILHEYSEERAWLFTDGLRHYLREGKFTEFQDSNIAKL